MIRAAIAVPPVALLGCSEVSQYEAEVSRTSYSVAHVEA